MRCPKCGYISFDHIDSCLKCTKDIKETSTDLQGTTFNAASPSFLAAFAGDDADVDINGETDYPEIDTASEDYNEELISEDLGDDFSLEDLGMEDGLSESVETDGDEEDFDLGGLDDTLTMDLGQFEDEADDTGDIEADIDLDSVEEPEAEPDEQADEQPDIEFAADEAVEFTTDLTEDFTGFDDDFGEELENMARDFESLDDESDLADGVDFEGQDESSIEDIVDFGSMEDFSESSDGDGDIASLGDEDTGFMVLDEEEEQPVQFLEEEEPIEFQEDEKPREESPEEETVVEFAPEVSEQDDLDFDLDLSDVVPETMYPNEDISEDKLSDVSLSEIDLSATVGSVGAESKEEGKKQDPLNLDPDLDFELDLHGLTLPKEKE